MCGRNRNRLVVSSRKKFSLTKSQRSVSINRVSVKITSKNTTFSEVASYLLSLIFVLSLYNIGLQIQVVSKSQSQLLTHIQTLTESLLLHLQTRRLFKIKWLKLESHKNQQLAFSLARLLSLLVFQLCLDWTTWNQMDFLDGLADKTHTHARTGSFRLHDWLLPVCWSSQNELKAPIMGWETFIICLVNWLTVHQQLLVIWLRFWTGRFLFQIYSNLGRWLNCFHQVEAESWLLMEPIICRLRETPIWSWRYELRKQITNCLSFFFSCELQGRKENEERNKKNKQLQLKGAVSPLTRL